VEELNQFKSNKKKSSQVKSINKHQIHPSQSKEYQIQVKSDQEETNEGSSTRICTTWTHEHSGVVSSCIWSFIYYCSHDNYPHLFYHYFKFVFLILFIAIVIRCKMRQLLSAPAWTASSSYQQCNKSLLMTCFVSVEWLLSGFISCAERLILHWIL